MKTKSILVLGLIALGFASCKEQCGECHYDDASGQEVEIGEYCGEDLETIEQTGYNVDGTNYVVHCGEH